MVFFETTASTLFLIRYDIAQLPLVYILTAFISVLLGVLYSKLMERLSLEKLLLTTMAFLASIIFIFYFIIQIYNLEFSYMGIMVFKEILWIFAGIEFGMISGVLFNIRQNKRLFGLLISGEILAGIIGGFSIGFLIKYMDTSQLLIISGITMLISFILILNILKKFSYKFEENRIPKSELNKSKSSHLELLKNNYYLLFFSISVLAFFVFYFIDYLFYLKVEQKFTDEKELASFLGVFVALLNIVNLFSSIYLSGKLLNRYGVFFALSLIPILAIIGTSSYLVFIGISLGAAFFILMALKLFNEAFDTSILTPTYKVIYQSIPAIHRNKVLTFRESIIEPIAMGIAGVLLLVLTQMQEDFNIHLIIIALALLWLFFAKHLKDNYIISLRKMLKKRKVFDDINLLSDIDTKFLLEKLKSANDMDILYALDFLGKLENKDFEDDLKTLLKNQNKQIRKKVIETINSLELLNLSPSLEEYLEYEKDSKLLSLAIYNYSNLLQEESLDKIKPFLNSKDKLLRNSTIISLSKYCGEEGKKIASGVIKNLIEDKSEKNRLEILQFIASSGFSNFTDIINDSLKNGSKKVKKEAINTIGELHILEFVPKLLKLLQDKEYKAVSVLALRKYKDEITSELIKEFEKTNIYEKKISLIKLLAFTKSDKNIKFLFEQLRYPIYKQNIIDTLYESNHISEDKRAIIKLINSIIVDILEQSYQIENFDKIQYKNSFELLKQKRKKDVESIFKALSFIYSKELINQAKANYTSGTKNFQALAIELIDNLIDKPLKQNIINILENFHDNQKLLRAKYKLNYTPSQNSSDGYINNLIEDINYPLIIRLAVIYEAGENKDTRYYKAIQNTLKKEKKPTVLETLTWAIKQFE